ncbi:MAG: lipase secretion chaperone [Burkholderia sp.]|jgi:lipase chaperone LimK|uniref:lipase secretion chaperone n=1 Tax=Burkholderia sp. TaxID=36773 RepID=UPI0028370B69|nr:lipase secretion chaperone [Burkholderia sp.]MDR0240473.1 lipase secretion chaperone [Burkholderia sp.]
MTVRGTLARGAWYGGIGAVAVAAVWHALGRSEPPVAPAPTPVAGIVPAREAPPAAVEASATALPAPLAGTHAPRLPVDAQGHLVKRRAVRDFFDYFLLAQNDVTAAALDALVAGEIAAQLDGTIAQSEALDVWRRYRAYLAALARLPDGDATSGSRFDAGAIAAALDRRDTLASRTLGVWSVPFFGAEQQRQRDVLARLLIVRDPTLTDAQKRERLAALEQSLPPDRRDEDARLTRQRDAVATVDRLERSGDVSGALQAQAVAALGPDVAARVVRMRQDDDAWQARYRDYAAERDRIDAQQLTPDARAAQVAQVRQRYFADPADASRAAALDAGAGR